VSNSVFVPSVLLGVFDFHSPPQEKRMKTDAHSRRRKWRRLNVVSKSMRVVPIFAGVPCREVAPNDSDVVLENGRCSDLSFEISDSKLLKRKPPSVIRSPSSAFQWSQSAWPWMTSKRDSRCFVLAMAPDASASTRLPCSQWGTVVPIHCSNGDERYQWGSCGSETLSPIFTARCYAERGYEIACRPTVCLPVYLSVRPWRSGTVNWSHKLEFFENNFTAK